MGISDALDAGVEVNSRRNGKSALLRTIVDGKRVNLDSARLLLRNGADADFQDANGNTFLHLAVSPNASLQLLHQMIFIQVRMQ